MKVRIYLRRCLAALFAILAVLTTPGAHAQDTTAAKLFVQRVYAEFANPDTRHEAQREDKFYSAGLYRLIVADRRGHPGEVGKLDSDPICDCQDPGDPGELKIQSITFAPRTPLTLKATVIFTITTESRTVTLSLLQTPSGWRIDDISTADTPSLRMVLSRK
jgi:hypothetical protein